MIAKPTTHKHATAHTHMVSNAMHMQLAVTDTQQA